MKKKSGNISILVIFVLLASSLLGILSMNYVQQMMKQSAVVNSYYKTYYLSKAWIELWLAQVQHRWIGFEFTVNTGDDIVTNNFLCRPNCSLSTTLSGTASLLSKTFWQGSGCENPYTLSGGESFIIPLFRDTTPWNVAQTFDSDISYENLAHIFKDGNQIDFISKFDENVTYGILILSGENLYENGIFFKKWILDVDSLTDFSKAFTMYITEIDKQFANEYWSSQFIEKWFKMYLMISNSSTDNQSFCVQTVQPNTLLQLPILPTDTFFIQSQASYGGQKVALDASYAQPIPGFLFDSYSSY